MSSSQSLEMDEVRRKAQSLLSSSGSSQDVKAEVQIMASIALPLSVRYQELAVEDMLRENSTGHSRQEVTVFASVLLLKLLFLTDKELTAGKVFLCSIQPT